MISSIDGKLALVRETDDLSIQYTSKEETEELHAILHALTSETEK